MSFPSELLNAYWHMTSIERFQSILHCGSIHPEPDIEDFRWSTNQGSKYYPFVRILGGVSIFDFNGFNPELYSKEFPMSSWRSFVPIQRGWKQAVWIQLSPERMPGEFLNGLQLKALQEENQAFRNNLMPRIECAHLGSIPVEIFVNVLRYEEKHGFTNYWTSENT